MSTTRTDSEQKAQAKYELAAKKELLSTILAMCQKKIPFDSSIIKQFVKQFKDINARAFGEGDYWNKTFLETAVSEHNQEVAAALLDAKADINFVDDDIRAPVLHHAVRDLDFDMVKFLLEHNADVNFTKPSQSGRGNGIIPPLLYLRFSYNIEIDPFGLDKASNDRRLAIANLLLAKGADDGIGREYEGFALLYSAVGHSDDKLLELVLKRWKVPQENLDRALEKAIDHSSHRTEYFALRSINIENSRLTNLKIAHMLLEKGANPNAIGDCYQHPLIHFAASKGSDETVRLFLEYGGDPLHSRENYRDLGYPKDALPHEPKENPLELTKINLSYFSMDKKDRPPFTYIINEEFELQQLKEEQNKFNLLHAAAMRMYVDPFKNLLDKILNLKNLTKDFEAAVELIKEATTPFNYFHEINMFVAALNRYRTWLLDNKQDMQLLIKFFNLTEEQAKHPFLDATIVKTIEKLSVSESHTQHCGLFKNQGREYKEEKMPVKENKRLEI